MVKTKFESLEALHTHTHTSNLNKEKGITLISLVITIIVLLILAGVTIATLTGNSILNKTQTASDETKKSQAAEAMNLKITNIQISSYTETQTLPNLQYLADKLCEDNDMEYVLTASKEHASLAETNTKPKIDVTNFSSIFTKLKAFPYEFEIDSSLQLASIDGVKISNTNSNLDNTENNNPSSVKISQDLENWINTLDGDTTLSVTDITNNNLLGELMQNRNSINYMLSNEVIFNAVVQSPYAMEELGKSEYGGYKVMLTEEHREKILNSNYISYFDKHSTQIPTLKTNTNVLASSTDSSAKAFYAFDKNSTTHWWSPNTTASQYIGYNFNQNVLPYKINIINLYSNGYRCKDFYIQGSNDNSLYTNLTEQLRAQETTATQTFLINSTNSYQYIRMYILNKYTSSNSTGISELQIYGRTIPNN